MPSIYIHWFASELIFQSGNLSKILCILDFLDNNSPFFLRKSRSGLVSLSIQSLQSLPGYKSPWSYTFGKFSEFA